MTKVLETYRGVVYPWQIDHMGHMNVQFYTARFDEATWQLNAALGLTPAFFELNRRGMAAVEQRTLYKRELHAGDLIRIDSELLELAGKKAKFLHRMYRVDTGEEVASSELVGVFIDTESRRSAEFPEEILERAKALSARRR